MYVVVAGVRSGSHLSGVSGDVPARSARAGFGSIMLRVPLLGAENGEIKSYIRSRLNPKVKCMRIV